MLFVPPLLLHTSLSCAASVMDRANSMLFLRPVSLIDANLRQTLYWQAQLLLRVSLSVMVHLIVPGGDCNAAVPLKTDLSIVPSTRRSDGKSCKVRMQPMILTSPLPVNVVPPQQKR